MPNWNKLNNDISQALLDTDRLEELLVTLGCQVKAGRDWNCFHGPCPVHGGDGDKFVVRPGRDIPIFWACRSRKCHNHGALKPTLLGLVRALLGKDRDHPEELPETLQFLEDFLARGAGRAPVGCAPRWRTPVPDSLSLTREQVRQRLEIPSRYFLGRGFSPAVLDRFDIGESPRLGRAVAPIYDDSGLTCVGCISRSVHPVCGHGEPRWMFSKGLHKGDYLYNFAAAKQSNAPFVLLVEGVPDVLRAAEAGLSAVTGFGNALSEPQKTKFALLNKQVVVAFDNDAPGRTGAKEVAHELQRIARTLIHHPPDGYKDVGEMSTEAVTRWFADLQARNPTFANSWRPWDHKVR